MIINSINLHGCLQSPIKVNDSKPQVEAHTHTHAHRVKYFWKHTPACNFKGLQLIRDSDFDISFQNHLMLERHSKASKRQKFECGANAVSCIQSVHFCVLEMYQLIDPSETHPA